ncbi:MAG: flagellar motor protein [Alphaproteobacteria bacterium]|nr:flagellar motor protein [Alphaproteobacteria bacterium]MBV9552021.1 flagellar motor protein [Alphaproteobacteria bacterium]
MDFLSVVGLVLGIGAIITSMLLDGGNPGSLIQLSAFIIVGGGTLAAVFVQTPLSIFLRGLKMLLWIFFPPRDDREEMLRQLTDWLRIARHQFVLALDPVADQQTDPFIRQALRLVVDGIEAPQIRVVLETNIQTSAHEELLGAEMYEAMGGYAPTVGILGAVMGLITVMSHLDDPSKLGEGIATAFVATVYGVGLANLFLLPVAAKLKFLAKRRVRRLEMIVEGIVGIAILESPLQLEMKLRSFLEHGGGESNAGETSAAEPEPAPAE